MGFLAGKRLLITGVLSNRSIAYGIAKAARDHGAEIALTYQGEAFKKRVEPLANELGAHLADEAANVLDHVLRHLPLTPQPPQLILERLDEPVFTTGSEEGNGDVGVWRPVELVLKLADPPLEYLFRGDTALE